MNKKIAHYLSMIGFIFVFLAFTACDNGTTTSYTYNTYNEFERRVFELTNIERAKQDISALHWDNRLGAAARAHSEDMASNDFMSHTGSDGSSLGQRITRTGFTYRRAAENVASGQGTPEEVINSWMNSEGHRNNILNSDLTHFGAGFVNNRWTQKFATPR